MPDINSESFTSSTCPDCPVQRLLGQELTTMKALKDAANLIGETLVGESGQQFDEYIEERLSTESDGYVNQFKKDVRKDLGGEIERFDEDITKISGTMSLVSLACDGILKMRATKKGITYTVTVCTSKKVLDNDDSQNRPAHIKTKTAD